MPRLRDRKEWKFFAVLVRADRTLALVWWGLLVLRGVLPAVFAIAMGFLVRGVQRGESLTGPLVLAGAVFVLLQVLAPIHQAVSVNLGDRTAAWLYDRLTEACVRPPGMGHLEDEKLAGRVEEPILGREAKLATLIELRARFGLAAHETMAVGDGANDLAMLGEAGLGVAFRAKPAVAAAAHARLDHADLSALLYAQGYNASEIVQE